jgi:hypothetical protein
MPPTPEKKLLKKVGKVFFEVPIVGTPAHLTMKPSHITKLEIAGGILIILVSLFNTDLSGEYENGILAHFTHPSLVKMLKKIGVKELYELRTNIYDTEDTVKYFDLTTTVDVKKTKKGYTRIKPTKGDGEYGGKIDIQFTTNFKRKPDYEQYLRLVLLSSEDEKDTGFPFQTHFRVEYGRADDMDIDKHLENEMKDAVKEFYKIIRLASPYFESINKPLWEDIDARISKYLTKDELSVNKKHYKSIQKLKAEIEK